MSTQKELQALVEKWLEAYDVEVKAKNNLARIRCEIAEAVSNVFDGEVAVTLSDGRVLVLQFDGFKLANVRVIKSVGSYL